MPNDIVSRIEESFRYWGIWESGVDDPDFRVLYDGARWLVRVPIGGGHSTYLAVFLPCGAISFEEIEDGQPEYEAPSQAGLMLAFIERNQ